MRSKDQILLEAAYNSIHNKPTEAMTENLRSSMPRYSSEDMLRARVRARSPQVAREIDQMVQTLNQDVNVDNINAVTKMTNDLVRSSNIEHALLLWSDLKNKLDRDKLEATLTMSVKGDYDAAAKDEFLNKSLPAIRILIAAAIRKALNP
jgi:DNA-directed RNA polymerase specialized sigma subunit